MCLKEQPIWCDVVQISLKLCRNILGTIHYGNVCLGCFFVFDVQFSKILEQLTTKNN